MKKSLILLAAVAALGLQACDVQVHDSGKTTVHEPQSAPAENTRLAAPEGQGAAASAPATIAAAPASAAAETTAAAPAPADATTAAAPASAATGSTAAASAPADTMAAASAPASTDNSTASTQPVDTGTTTAQAATPSETATMGASAASAATGDGSAAPTELQRFFEDNGSRLKTGKSDAQPAAQATPAAAARRKVAYELPTMRDPGDPEGSQLLAQRALLVPVVGVAPAAIADNYEQGRGSGKHEAIDILAPRGTAVVAVDDGNVAKLFTSRKGGLTVYQFDPQGRLAYYYAHLDHYAAGLRDGMSLRRGDPVGYVGTTGDADPGTPHLHFAVFKLGPEKQWWKGAAVNPYGALRVAQPATTAALR